MSEYAKAVVELPVSPARREAEREANRLFRTNRAKLKDAILDDKRLPHTYRLIGRAIADGLNFRTGYAWPSQEFLAQKVRCGLRTVKRAVALLVDDQNGWFRREVDGRNNCYFPRFERLNRGHDRGQPCPPIGAKDGVTSGPLSSVENHYNENLINRPSEQTSARRQPITQPDVSKADRLKDGVVAFGKQDEIITELARKEGKSYFVFQDSEPWQRWEAHLNNNDKPPMVPRRHMVKGVWRTGCDVPSLYPPGADRYDSPTSRALIECSGYLVENIRRRGVQSPGNQAQNKFDRDRQPT
jgi:hypothetical protein